MQNNDILRLAIPDGLLFQQKPVKLPPRQSLSQRLLLCEVHDVLAYGHCYIVKGTGTPRMIAVLGSPETSMTPIGARSLSMIPPGSLVVVWINETYFPVILAVVATPMGSSRLGIPDSIVGASHAGFFADPAHQILASRPDGHGFVDFSAGRPIDNLPGDWGKFNELGLGFFLGKLMTYMRSSDICKLEMFYDHLARLFSYNWQHYTAGSEREALNDEGEWTDVEGFNPYPWEAAGISALGQLLLVEQSTNQLDPKTAKTMIYEPKDPLQTGFWRLRTFHGFLGDLERRYVQLPNRDVEVMRYGTQEGDYPKSQTPAYTGVFDQLIGIDGSYVLRSAKRVLLEKTCWIPVPEEMMPRDNPKGDTDFANPSGIGTTLPEFNPPEDSGSSQLSFADRHAYFCQKFVSQGTNLRQKDWRVKDDPPKTPGDFTVEIPPLYPYSSFQQPLPEQAEKTVDHRKKVRYYKGRARIEILDDGGVVMEDAYGSSVKLFGGNLEISCPGDIIFRSGRDVQTWSGRDVVAKSNRSVDISASQEDVRIKAERNLMVLGGNRGTGGVLIENRGSGDMVYESNDTLNIGGLILKCSRGVLGITADTLHLRTDRGPVILDAKSGESDVIVFGRSLEKFLTRGSMEVIAPQMEQTPVANLSIVEHTQNQYQMIVKNTLLASSGITVINSILERDGTTSIRLKGSLSVEGRVSATGGSLENETESVFDHRTALQSMNDNRNAVKNDVLDPVAQQELRETTALSAAAPNIGFRFRASDELGLNNVRIFEAPWQQRFRRTQETQAGDKFSGPLFVEKDVYPRVNPNTLQNEGRPTMPYPGYEAWEGAAGAVFVSHDDVFYSMDRNGGKPIPRGTNVDESYALSKLKTPVESVFKDRYPVNV